MAGFLVERRLRKNSDRLRRLREELAIANDQLDHFADDAEDAAIRALVSDDPMASGESVDSRRHVDAMRRHRERLIADIASLEEKQDELLDQLGVR